MFSFFFPLFFLCLLVCVVAHIWILAGSLGAEAWFLVEGQWGRKTGGWKVTFPNCGGPSRQTERHWNWRGLSLGSAVDMLPRPPFPHSRAALQLSTSLYCLIRLWYAQGQSSSHALYCECNRDVAEKCFENLERQACEKWWWEKCLWYGQWLELRIFDFLRSTDLIWRWECISISS